MSETNNTKKKASKKIETLRHACRGYETKELKKIATVSTNQINVLSELVLKFPANDNGVIRIPYVDTPGNKEKIDGLRSVRAAVIDVIVERLGENAGDKLMNDLGL